MTRDKPGSRRREAKMVDSQDKPSADFFDALAAHFGVDLEIEDWPAMGD